MAKCSKCGAETAEGSKFCSSCGAPLPQVSPAPSQAQAIPMLRCSQCGAETPAGSKFCASCGVPFQQVAYGIPQPQAVPTPAAQPQLPLKHSGLGIISFILFLVNLVLSLIAVILAMGEEKTANYFQILGGVGILGSIICLLGIIFGIAGVIKKNRKKVFAILGLVLNLIIGILFVAAGLIE